jgi:hypothetical protein
VENRVTKKADDSGAVLLRLVDWYQAAEDATADARQEAEQARDYYDDKQLTAAEIATLKKRKQPPHWSNRIKPKINYLLGTEAQKRTDPKAYPRNPADEEAATAASDALRYVTDDQKWDRKRSECFSNFLVEGACGVDVAVREAYGKDGDYCIDIKPIMWDRMWWDPHSRARDFSDAKYIGQFVWMDLDDAVSQWPDSADVLEAMITGNPSTNGETYDDVPRQRWTDPKRKRVRIAECWSKEGNKVFYTKFTQGGVLERIESPYKNEDGEPERGPVFGSCFIDRDGDRYGVVRSWIPIQDEINKRRSKALHLMSVRQTYGNASALADVNKARNELARPDGHVEMQGGSKFGEDFGILPTGDMAAAQVNLLQEAKQEIDSVGVNAAQAGTEQRVMSGRALIAKQESGLSELGPVFDGFNQYQHDVYRRIWNCIKQFWTKEKWVRVTDDDKNVKFVGLNQPLTLGEKMLNEAKQSRIPPAQLQELEMQIQQDPMAQQIVGTKNNMGELDVDITIDDVPATASLQQEQFETLAQIAPQAGTMPQPLFEALIMASGLRNKDKIIEKLKGGGEQDGAAAQIEQIKQEAQQMMGELQARVEELEKDKSIDLLKLEIEQYKAETDRLQATAPAMPQEAVQAIVMQTVQELLTGPQEQEQPLPQIEMPQEPMPEQMEPPPMDEPQMMPPDMPPEMMQPDPADDAGFFIGEEEQP